MNPTYLLAWIPESLLDEKGPSEWDKFIKVEEKSNVDEDEGNVMILFYIVTSIHSWVSSVQTAY